MFKLSRPLYGFLAALTYLLGASVAAYLGEPFQLAPFALGLFFALTIQAALSLLSEAFRPHNEPLIRGETAQEKETLRNQTLIFSLGLISAAMLTVLIVYLNFKLPSPTALFWGASFLLTLLYAVPPFSLASRGFGELILALHLGYVIPFIAFFFQMGRTPNLAAFLFLPLAALGLAYFLILNFASFADDQKYERGTLLRILGWERVIALHHSLIIFAYFAFALFPFFGFSIKIVAPAFLSLPFALFQMIQLRAVGNGSPPHWTLLKSSALIVFGLTVYLLTLALWMQ